jgi:hypothetical protein
MTQSKLESLIESTLNVIVGYIVAILSQLIIFPLFGIQVSFGENLLIGLWFTGISLARSYVLRRYFNRRLHHAAERLAGGHKDRQCKDRCQFAVDVGMSDYSCRQGYCVYKDER